MYSIYKVLLQINKKKTKKGWKNKQKMYQTLDKGWDLSGQWAHRKMLTPISNQRNKNVNHMAIQIFIQQIEENFKV